MPELEFLEFDLKLMKQNLIYSKLSYEATIYLSFVYYEHDHVYDCYQLQRDKILLLF